jgi:hypothetical protein
MLTRLPELKTNKESSDVVLRWQGKLTEQMQLQIHQEKLTVEDRFEKLQSQIVELRELALARNKSDAAPCTLSSAGKSSTSSDNTDVPTALANSVTSANTNSSHSLMTTPTTSSGLGNSECLLPLSDDNSE